MADIRKRTGSKGTTYQVRYPSPEAKSGYAYASFETLREARAFTENLGGHKHAPGGTLVSVSEAVDRWLDICEKIGRDGREKVEPTTLVEYRRRAEIIKAHPWKVPLHELEPADVVRFRNWLLEQRSRDLARRTLSSFHSVIIEMGRHGLIKDDPAAGITIRSDGRYDDSGHGIEIPTDAEMRDLLAATDAMAGRNRQFAKAWAKYKPMIYLAAFTGMRPSEYRGLPWSSIDVDRVHVRQRADKDGRIGPVKSRAGRRTIYIPALVSDMLDDWKEACPPSAHDLVFPTATGRPMALNNFTRRAWEPLLKEAGLVNRRKVKGRIIVTPKYTPYALRHYFASKLIEKGKDLKFIQTCMGHADIQLTLNVYGHLLKDREAEHQRTAEDLAAELIAAE